MYLNLSIHWASDTNFFDENRELCVTCLRNHSTKFNVKLI